MLLEEMERPPEAVYLIMDRTYEGDRTRAKGVELGYIYLEWNVEKFDCYNRFFFVRQGLVTITT